MGAWYKSKEAQHIDLVCNLLAVCIVFYMLVRHALLATGRLQVDDVQCGDCSKAAWVWFKSPCKNSTAARGNQRSQVSDKDKAVHMKVIFLGTFGTLLLYLLSCVNMSVSYMSQAFIGLLPFSYCVYSAPVTAVLTVMAKACMLSVFIARLHIGFHGSVYAYSKKLIYVLYASLVTFVTYMIAIVVLFLRGERLSNYCVTSAPVYFIFGGVFFDILLNGALVYLFSAAIWKMLRSVNASRGSMDSGKPRNVAMYMLPLKYAVLTTVAVVSTMTTMFLYGTVDFSFLLPWDSVFNCAALLFMTTKWKPAFAFFCGPLIQGVANCFLPADLLEPKSDVTSATNRVLPMVSVSTALSATTSKTDTITANEHLAVVRVVSLSNTGD